MYRKLLQIAAMSALVGSVIPQAQAQVQPGRTLVRAGRLLDVHTGRELEGQTIYVNQYGMTPLAAIQSATLNGADLMGWTDRAGSLDPGKWADIIAVQGDPLRDIRILEHVPFVMKSGIVYKDEAHPDEVRHLSAIQLPTPPEAGVPAF